LLFAFGTLGMTRKLCQLQGQTLCQHAPRGFGVKADLRPQMLCAAVLKKPVDDVLSVWKGWNGHATSLLGKSLCLA
jgi:hypothetical protein